MKRLAVIVCACMVMMLIGCSTKKTAESSEQGSTSTQTSNQSEDTTSEKEQSTEVNQDTTEKADTSEQEPVSDKKVVVYFPDAEGNVQNKEVSVTEVSEKTLWQQLKDAGVVNQDTEALALEFDDNSQITLNVNHAFGEQLRSQGTMSEDILFRCVIDSYLDTFACNRIMVREEGEVLESGHVSYDGFFEKY